MDLGNYHSLLGIVYFLLLSSNISLVTAVGEVIWAVNCGGDQLVDSSGVRYQKDFLKVGTASDYGRSLTIQRVRPEDQLLYQTERYHSSDFGYDIPIREDGSYVLVMKFSEVWFSAVNQKVFDVHLNELPVVDDLDIFAKVGRGTAHDEIIPFSVNKGLIKLRLSGKTAELENGRVNLRFIKKPFDNPKVNAVYLMKGNVADVPKLPDLPNYEQMQQMQQQQKMNDPVDDADEGDDDSSLKRKKRASSGPKVIDPYQAEEAGSMMLPVVIAIGAFIPLVFCLCKL